MEQYRNYLNSRGWDIRNPAFYVTDLNMIVAGSDAGRYAERLARARKRSAALLEKYERLDAAFPAKLKEVQQQLAQAGLNDRQIRSELTLRKKAWDNEKAAVNKEVLRVNRQNEAKFSVVTDSMFARLYHEAFHAYLENYVYPRRQNNIPGWLNEGLAQIFEKGQLEAGSLRIDGTNDEAVRRIRADYLAGRLMPLERLLESNSKSFLSRHADRDSNRAYAYAWALTRHLVDDYDLLDGKRLERFAIGSKNATDTQRFEQLVRMPMGRFESKWHAAVGRLCEPRNTSTTKRKNK